MSGLKAGLGYTDYADNGGKIEYPAIGADDRIFALRSAWQAGHQLGRRDAATLAHRRTWPEANPVPASHLKLHCDTALRGIAPTITATQLSANTLRQEWMDGYAAGFDSYLAGGVGMMMGEGGE